MARLDSAEREELHRALQEAQIKCDEAEEQYRKAFAIFQDLGFTHPDIVRRLNLAASECSNALEKYVKALSGWR